MFNKTRIILLIAIALVVYNLSGGGGSILPIISVKPINLPGFNVLVLTDTSQGGVDSVTIRSTDVRKWLRENADKAYFWDDSMTDFSDMPSEWKDAFDKAKEDSGGERPWVLVSGNGGTSQKLPGRPADFISLLEKYK